MKMRTKKVITLCVMALTALLLTGCMSKSADDLYSLPQLSEGYIQLQECIDEVLASGAVYSAPASGSYRQAVQLIDFEGDGTNEAVAFFSNSGDDKPLKIYVFRRNGGDYETAAVIEGEGTSIESVGFADMNDDGMLEIAAGWQLSADMNVLSVYAMNGYQPAQIIHTDYDEYSLTQLSGRDDIVVFRLSGADISGEAELYVMESDGEIVSSRARLTDGVEAMLRIRTSLLLHGGSAVYVEGAVSSGVVTDIFTCRGNQIFNITTDDIGELKNNTERTYSVYSRDINGDGVLDVPKPILLPTQSKTTSYYLLEWYSYAQGGSRTVMKTTYHNYSDGWYITVPDEWIGALEVRREDSVSGERAVVFTERDGSENGKDFLVIYALSGENRDERAKAGTRFILKEEESVIYAAEILADITGAELPVNEQLVKENFDIIYSEWITGDI